MTIAIFDVDYRDSGARAAALAIEVITEYAVLTAKNLAVGN